MAMANRKDMISSEEARIMLLEQKNDDFHQTLKRLESKIDNLDNKLDSKIDALDTKFETKFDALDNKFETKFDALDTKFESKYKALDNKLDSQNTKIDSHFRWTVGLIFGLYATAFATLLGTVGKAYHWF